MSSLAFGVAPFRRKKSWKRQTVQRRQCAGSFHWTANQTPAVWSRNRYRIGCRTYRHRIPRSRPEALRNEHNDSRVNWRRPSQPCARQAAQPQNRPPQLTMRSASSSVFRAVAPLRDAFHGNWAKDLSATLLVSRPKFASQLAARLPCIATGSARCVESVELLACAPRSVPVPYWQSLSSGAHPIGISTACFEPTDL